MVIEIDADLAVRLAEEARNRGVTPEELAVRALQERFPKRVPPIEPRNDWERNLLAIAVDCGVSLSSEALSRETMYD